jgi:hypothetical protein
MKSGATELELSPVPRHQVCRVRGRLFSERDSERSESELGKFGTLGGLTVREDAEQASPRPCGRPPRVAGDYRWRRARRLRSGAGTVHVRLLRHVWRWMPLRD